VNEIRSKKSRKMMKINKIMKILMSRRARAHIINRIMSRIEYKIRSNFLRKSCFSVGKNLVVYDGIRVHCPEQLSIGNNVAVNNDVWINATGTFRIGNHVLIGPKVIIHSANHRYDDPNIPIQKQGHVFRKVIIEDDVWIGGGAIILPGVKIGKGAVIGAGSVVTRDVPPYTVVAGSPARKIKDR